MVSASRLIRLGNQILMTLSVVTIVFFLFYTMSTDRHTHNSEIAGNDQILETVRKLIGEINNTFAEEEKEGTKTETNKDSPNPDETNNDLFYNEIVDTNSTEIEETNKDSSISDENSQETHERNDRNRGPTRPEETNANSKYEHLKKGNKSQLDMEKLDSRKQSPVVKISSVNSTTVEAPVSSSNKTRYLIYLCDRRRACGGWGDRQKGLTAAYILSVVTGRKFGVNMSYPCDIKTVYIPNKIDWYVKNIDIEGLSWEVIDWVGRYHHEAEDCRDDFNVRHPSDVVFLRSNKDVYKRILNGKRYGHLVPDQYRNTRKAFMQIWHNLMRPSYHLQELIDKFLMKVPRSGDLVCAHVRIGRNKDLPNDSRSLNSISTVDSLWRFLARFENNASRIFIATDSLNVRELARKNLGVKELDTGGALMHVDRQGKSRNACNAFEVGVLEQYVLSTCHKLVVTYSGFSIRAAMMSRIHQEKYVFKNGTIKPWNF